MKKRSDHPTFLKELHQFLGAEYSLDDAVDVTVTRAKVEVLIDVHDGKVPANIKNYSELHDYVDANYYGGAFEWPCLPSEEMDERYVEEHSNFWNRVQCLVNEWIISGGLFKETESYEGVWLPSAEVLCWKCHGPQLRDGSGTVVVDFEQRSKRVSEPADRTCVFTFCDDCGRKIWLPSWDDAAALHNLQRTINDKIPGAIANMGQLGGMVPGVTVHVQAEPTVFFQINCNWLAVWPYTISVYMKGDEIGEWNGRRIADDGWELGSVVEMGVLTFLNGLVHKNMMRL